MKHRVAGMYRIGILLISLVSIQALSAQQSKPSPSPQNTLSLLSAQELDASSTLDPSTLYWVTDPGKEGAFVFAGQAKDQTEDNGGTLIVNAALQRFKRIYSGHIDARWFGVTADATTPTQGIFARGTNNSPALQKALDAAAEGELVMVPAGKYLFASPLDTIKGPKRINLTILGDTYHNGSDFIIINNSSGVYEQHTIRHEGIAAGRINMPRHTKATHDNGTAPKWSEFTGTLVKIYNAYQQKVELNKVEGFRTPVEIIGGGKQGSQENTIWIRSAYKNAVGFILTSLDGQSYTDKNEFRISRLSGGLGFKIDGYAGKAPNGEVYNGAARSNRFHLMIEQVDSIAECHGDITEPLFDITVEGGDHTGVFGQVGFRMRSVAPNFVRAPKYTGQGILETRMVQHGLGIGGTLNVPVWHSAKGIFYGNYALIDNEGNLVFMREGSMMKAYRDAAPSNFRFVNFGDPELDVNITAAAYTVAPHVRYVYYKHNSGNVTLPTAHTSVGRLITIFNEHETAKLGVLNVKKGPGSVIAPGAVMTYRCNGAQWRPVTNP